MGVTGAVGGWGLRPPHKFVGPSLLATAISKTKSQNNQGGPLTPFLKEAYVTVVIFMNYVKYYHYIFERV